MSATTTSSRARTTPTARDLIYFQGHCAPGVYARAFLEGRLTEDDLDRFRRETGRRGRAVVVSAPAADAGLLAVPDGLDGPRPDDGDLPGALHALPAAPRPDPDERRAGVGVPRRRRDGRARVARRDLARGAREARQPDVRRQLQPAAPRRPGARQRQDHPGARGRVPRRRLERVQGDLGRRLGSAAGQGPQAACWSSAWKRRSTATTRTTSRATARGRASTSSASTPSCSSWSRT